MDKIRFSIGCRTCRETNGERYEYDYDDPEGQLPLAGRSEFGIMRMLETFNNDVEARCSLCQSTHLELFDIT